MFHKAGMLAADGRCKTLDAAADGYVRGEAVGALLLQAVQLLAHQGALALFCGSAVNQDGRSSSLTAPNGPSQQEVVRQALAFGRLAATDVSYLQMHGTGTPLGDPIEMGAAAAVLVDGARRSLPLGLSTAKCWIGHTEAAAGAMGLTHAGVALSHRLAHGIMHLTAINSHVAAILDMSAAKAAAPGWHLPRMALPAGADASGSSSTAICGVSSFAFQGTNAHALLQQADCPTATHTMPSQLAVWNKQRVWVAPPVHILLLSAAATSSSRFARRQTVAAVALEVALGAPKLAFLWQHSVLGMAMFPATAFLEMAAGASRQLLNRNDLSGTALRSAVFATPLALPTVAAAATRVRCVVQAAAGTFEISSAATNAAQHRTHFYASFGRKEPTTGGRLAALSVPAAPATLAASVVVVVVGRVPTMIARLAVAEVAVPEEQLGMSVHPAVSEAAMHVAAAHQPQHRALRVAARMDAVLMPLPVADMRLWASSLVVGAAPGVAAAAAGSGRQEQQLIGSGGLTMLMAGMETRRLVAKVPLPHNSSS